MDVETAVLSVLVLCSEHDMTNVKQLQRTLPLDHIAAQYAGLPTTPEFQVYIWASLLTLCDRTDNDIDGHINCDGTSLCGAWIPRHDSTTRLCTAATVIKADSLILP